MSTIVNIQEAKTNLSKLINRACAGEEIIIANRNRHVAQIVPLDNGAKTRRLGVMPGPAVPDSFFEALSDDELKDWGML